MRFNLRSILMTSAVLAAAALATNSAMAETTVNVPFSFVAAGKVCPAGRYTVERDLAHNFVTLVGRSAPVGFRWLLNPGDDARKSSEVTLRFDGNGQDYTLDTILYGKQSTPHLDKHANHSEHKTIRDISGL